MPIAGETYHRPLTDTNGTALTNFVVRVDLNAGNFDFTKCRGDGADLRIRDETAGALVPMWLQEIDATARAAVLYYLATATAHAHAIYFGSGSATSVSDFASVFAHGTGFDADWGDLTTAAAGTYGAATRYAAPANSSDVRNFAVWRVPESPCLQISDMTSAGIPADNYTGLREFCLLRDSSNRVLKVGGKYYVFFTRRPSTLTDHHQVWRAESTSKSGSWGNFTLIYDPPSGIRLGYPGSVLKIGSTYHLYISYGWSDVTGASPPGLSVYHLTSSDLTTWSAAAQCLAPAVFNDQTSGACTDIGNFKVIGVAGGTYVGTIEGKSSTSGNRWGCYGATSADGVTWSAANSGNVLVGNGGAGTWDNEQVANPAPFQFPDGTFGIMYNGSDNFTNSDWQLGWATCATFAGTYTKHATNPFGGKTYGSYGWETSAFCWDEDGVTPYMVAQVFATNSNTAAFYLLSQEKRRGGLILSRDAPGTGVSNDGAVAGTLVAAGNFTYETQSAPTAHRATAGTMLLAGLYNAASLPTPAAIATFAGARIVEVIRWTRDYGVTGSTGPGDVSFSYAAASTGTINWWNGAAWTAFPTTTGRAIAADNAREVTASISSDGTNYILTAAYSDDGTVIASATVPIASCLAWTNRLAWCGDIATNGWQGGTYFRRIGVRPYAATAPAMSVGASVQDAATWYTVTAPGTTTGLAGTTSGAYTVAFDAPYSGTITATPSGGGLSASIVLSFASATPQTFTITPSSAGTVTLTFTNSGGLPDPPALLYTATAPPTDATTWQCLAITYAFDASRAGSMGYTVYAPDGSVVVARSTVGIARIGNAFVALAGLPWAGAVLIDWDDGATHDTMPVFESYVAPGVTLTQGLNVALAMMRGASTGGGLTFFDVDGVTPRNTGTVAAGDRTSSTMTPIT